MKSRKNLGVFLVLLLLLTIIPLTVWSVKNLRFETRKKASEPVPVEEKEFSEIRPLNISQPIYKFTVSAKLTLKKENSFFRIILIDKNQKEYLVYEAYLLIVNDQKISLNNVCEETCALEAITPDKLRIEGLATDFEITQTSYEDKFQNLPGKVQSLGIERSQAELKKEKESIKIQKLNEKIKAKGMKWVAGETSISKLSYEEKKKLFSKPDGTPVDKLPNLQGFEYYKGGIFEIKSDSESPSSIKGVATSNLPVSWDWRNVHGENWNTPIKFQGYNCGSCWAFAATAATETNINLFYNQHANFDLSEQDAVSCSGAGSCNGGLSSTALEYYVNTGIVDEDCFPYQATDLSCLTKCNNWKDRLLKVGGVETSLTVDDENKLKRLLIKKGAISTAVISLHTMSLVGYETDKKDGATIWIFKSSWGRQYGEDGYVRVKTSLEDLYMVSLPVGPYNLPRDRSHLPANFSDQINCVDKDGDDYCNWGISENKPNTCPAFCKPEKDCDDSDPNLGPFDNNFNCIILKPNLTPTPLPQFGSCGSCSSDVWGGCTPPNECRLINDDTICKQNNKLWAPCCLRDVSCSPDYIAPCGYAAPGVYCGKCQRFQDSSPWCTGFQLNCGAGKPAQPRIKSPSDGTIITISENPSFNLSWYTFSEGLGNGCGETLVENWRSWSDCYGVVHWNTPAACIPEVGDGNNAGDRSCWGYVCAKGSFGILPEWRFYTAFLKIPGEQDFNPLCKKENIPNPSIVGQGITNSFTSCSFTPRINGQYQWYIRAGYSLTTAGGVYINYMDSPVSTFEIILPLTPTPTSFPTPSSCPQEEKGNLNCDTQGLINETDLTILLSKWGETNLPSIETLLSHWKTF